MTGGGTGVYNPSIWKVETGKTWSKLLFKVVTGQLWAQLRDCFNEQSEKQPERFRSSTCMHISYTHVPAYTCELIHRQSYRNAAHEDPFGIGIKVSGLFAFETLTFFFFFAINKR